jgi:hypothetical protein
LVRALSEIGEDASEAIDGLKYLEVGLALKPSAIVLFFFSPGCCIAVLGGTPDERCPSTSGDAVAD